MRVHKLMLGIAIVTVAILTSPAHANSAMGAVERIGLGAFGAGASLEDFESRSRVAGIRLVGGDIERQGGTLSGDAFIGGEGDPIRVEFEAGTSVVGSWVGLEDDDEEEAVFVEISVYDLVGNLVDEATIELGSAQFIGFGYDAGIGSIEWETDEGDFAIDDLRFGSAPIATPEPGTASLLGLGFAGLAAMRRRVRP